MTTRPLDDTTKPSRINRRRKKRWRVQSLTSITPAVMIRSHSQKTSVGFGRPFIQGARAMRRKSCGFFYAQNPFMAGGVVGGRKACRTLGPVDQPVTSSAAQSLVAPCGGLTASKESPMTNHYAPNAPEFQGEICPSFGTLTLNEAPSAPLFPSMFTAREAGLIKKALKLIEDKCLRTAPALQSREDFDSYLRLRFAGLTNEQMHVLYLDLNRRLLATEVEFLGDHKSASFDIRKVVLRAIALGADSLVFAHNHPSGNPTPSDADIKNLTGSESILKSLNIVLLDSFVVTTEHVVSIKEVREMNIARIERQWQAQREQWDAERKAKREANRQAKLQAKLLAEQAEANPSPMPAQESFAQ
jgi:DNA repair protein RadC